MTKQELADIRLRLRLISTVDRLLSLGPECEWFEFKHNNANSKMVGETVSALANGARLHDEQTAYILWGIEDETNIIIGTDFDPAQKVHGQPFEMWLSQMLMPAPVLKFHVVEIQSRRLVLLEIGAATDLPVAFDRIPRIRIGSATPPLRDYSEYEKALLAKLRPFLWEQGVVASDVAETDVVELLDLDAFQRLRGFPRPTEISGFLERLADSSMIKPSSSGGWDITNLGAVLLARDISAFPDIERKALRIIQYSGKNRLGAKPEQSWTQGYAAGFSNTLKFLEGILPAQEVIGATRTEDRVYPSEAIKELLANTLIHQDMTVTGAGPKIEIFSDRIEFSNPGEPVTDWNKLFGVEPRSRNERLAMSMRKMDLCEERGSGLRRIITATNAIRLLPPEFNASNGSTKVILHGHKRDFDAMDPTTKNRAIFQYASLLHEEGKWLTNAGLRSQFPMKGNATVKASAAIRSCVTSKLIKVADPNRPNSGYLPFWA